MPSRPRSGRFSGGHSSNSGAHEDGVGFECEFFGFGGKGSAGLMNGDAAQQAFTQGELVVPFFGNDAQNAHGFSGDFRTDAVARKH
jgi:hypothetical protein